MGPVRTPALRYDIVRRFSALSNSLGSPCAKGKCQCSQRTGLGISVPHSFTGDSNRKHRHRPVCTLGIYLLFPPSRTQGTNRLGVAAGQLSSLLQLRKFSPSLEGLGKRNQLGAPGGSHSFIYLSLKLKTPDPIFRSLSLWFPLYRISFC